MQFALPSSWPFSSLFSTPNYVRSLAHETFFMGANDKLSVISEPFNFRAEPYRSTEWKEVHNHNIRGRGRRSQKEKLRKGNFFRCSNVFLGCMTSNEMNANVNDMNHLCRLKSTEKLLILNQAGNFGAELKDDSESSLMNCWLLIVLLSTKCFELVVLVYRA